MTDARGCPQSPRAREVVSMSTHGTFGRLAVGNGLTRCWRVGDDPDSSDADRLGQRVAVLGQCVRQRSSGR